MSNGNCQDNCKSSYVFAVIQGQNCWCSNYIPKNQVNTGDCSTACPGFPSEKCGNPDQSLFAYFNLGGTPSGTTGGSAATSKPSSVSNNIPRPSFGPSSRTSFSVSVLTSSVSSQRSVLVSSSTSSFSEVSETGPSVSIDSVWADLYPRLAFCFSLCMFCFRSHITA